MFSRAGLEHRSVVAIGALVFGLGCEEVDRILKKRCQSDMECAEGQVCNPDGECVSKDNVSCQSVLGGQAILQPGTPVVDFGQVGPATSFRPLALRNIGNCTLTIFDAAFESEDASMFECGQCAMQTFPFELFPFRDSEFEIAFTPPPDVVGDFHDNLILLSDDAEFPEMKVPVRARFNGVPEIRAIPLQVDFGFAPVGRTLQQQVEIFNGGTGTAPLTIIALEIEPTGTTAFSLSVPLAEPVRLDPPSVDRDSSHRVTVQYHPREIGQHSGALRIVTDRQRNSTLDVPIRGTSRTPPKIEVSPDVIRFGPVPLAQPDVETITIVNSGGSPLIVTYHFAGTVGGAGISTDLSASPAVLPPIEPGQFTELLVFVTATAPGPIAGLLILDSNDPNRPSITIPVSAEGDDVVGGAQVLKLDMSFENSSNSVFDGDFRNVDMALENPFGLIVDKRNANPSNWGMFGSPSWISFGAGEEPERIVLADAMQDGTFRVILTYAEDCSSVPSALVAAVLGISIDLLIGALLGGGIGPSAGDISDVIDDLCFNHSSASVTVTVYLNGQIVAEVPSSLGSKGDFVYAADLIRNNGQYTVR